MAVNNPETTHAARLDLGRVLGLTSTAYFMVVLDSVVVITALPRMQRDLHVGLASLQWTLTAYKIAFAAGIITAAALGDRFGRRRIFNIGLALSTVASAVCALAPNASELIAARTVQGLGGAIVLPLSLTILTTAFPAERRGMIVGIDGGLAGLAVAMGPIVGGAVTQGIDWHWIFWINVPIGAVAPPLARRMARQLRRPGAARAARRHTPNRRRRCHCLGLGSREPVGLGERRDRQLPGFRRCPAARLRRRGTARQRTDGATAPVSQPCVRGRQRHDLPHDGRDLRRRVSPSPRSPSSPAATPPVSAGDACSHSSPRRCSSTDRGRRLRPHRPPTGHGDRALLDRRVRWASPGPLRRAGSSWTSPS